MYRTLWMSPYTSCGFNDESFPKHTREYSVLEIKYNGPVTLVLLKQCRELYSYTQHTFKKLQQNNNITLCFIYMSYSSPWVWTTSEGLLFPRPPSESSNLTSVGVALVLWMCCLLRIGWNGDPSTRWLWGGVGRYHNSH